MIHRFSISNYLSIKEALEIDLRVTPGQGDDNTSFIAPSGQRLSKAQLLVGANASGKTNILHALNALSYFTLMSFSLAPDAPTGFEPHMFSQSDISEFRITFESDGEIYEYQLAVTPEQVVLESLKKKTSRLFSRIFSRDWDETTASYFIQGINAKSARLVRKNCSLLAWLRQHNEGGMEVLHTQLELGAWSGNMYPAGEKAKLPGDFLIERSAEILAGDPELVPAVLSVLKRFDICIDDIQLLETGTSGIWIPYFVHKQGNKVKNLSVYAESSGTKRLFGLLGVLLNAIKDSSLILLDEIEDDLHPVMLEALFKLFLSKEFNPHNAQLIIATHAIELMNRLHKGQITLVEKHDHATETYALSQVEGVHSRDNFMGKYIAGAYGAIPEIF
ncbi:AAA family ATPase [Amantichitinum ursilacus]|uniref:ATPase AAA-type core domain-containing protein n=1 Tax=Amantichitinum ursilacus TaxID=857265 RepID=A0A0N0GQQ5_9NEIS|nr:ATP-binding protein [Amantichitinum ursilacus]KPC55001.1 hypothetical protein WG78_00040 [Amantichitinum ursilacus]